MRDEGGNIVGRRRGWKSLTGGLGGKESENPLLKDGAPAWIDRGMTKLGQTKR